MTIIPNFGRLQAGCIPISPTRKPKGRLKPCSPSIRASSGRASPTSAWCQHQEGDTSLVRKQSCNASYLPIIPNLFDLLWLFNTVLKHLTTMFFLVDLPQTPLLPPDPLLSPRHTKASWNTPPPAVSTMRTPRSGASSVVFGRRSGGWRVTRATKGAPLVEAQDQNSQQLQCACGMESWSWKTQVLVQ